MICGAVAVATAVASSQMRFGARFGAQMCAANGFPTGPTLAPCFSWLLDIVSLKPGRNPYRSFACDLICILPRWVSSLP